MLVSNRVRTKSSSAVEIVTDSVNSASSTLSAFETNDLSDPVDPYSMPTSVELLDDFYAISQLVACSYIQLCLCWLLLSCHIVFCFLVVIC